jgi:indolepyruvate ferredoxin oxidoreductase alpha subunit
MATSISIVKPEKYAVAIIGDSTFWHTGLSGLANAIWKNANILVMVMDNYTTAMTGDQINPSSENTLDIAKVSKSMGAKVLELDPFEHKASKALLKNFINQEGVKVVVSKSPCALNLVRAQRRNNIPGTVAEINLEKCNGCKQCITPLGCPALGLNADLNVAQVDSKLCTGCMLCEQFCRRNAISEVER